MLKRVAFLIVASALATPAYAQSTDAQATLDPDHIITVLKDAGYPAEYYQGSNASDYRQILSKSGNYQFLVELYECTDSKACQTLEFYSNFPMEEPPTKERLDAYSGPREGARISLNRQGVAVMKQEIAFSPEEGLPDEVFLERLKNWETMMAGFAAYLHQPPGGSAADAAADAAEAAAAAPAGEPADAT
jgi:hypothetical protein